MQSRLSRRTMSRSRLPLVLAALVVMVPSARLAGAQECIGDCNHDRRVTTAELIAGVNMSLGGTDPGACDAFDPNGDLRVTVDELVAGVAGALDGCPRRTGTFEITLVSGGLERQALVTVPASLDPNVPAPLVLNFHGVIATAETIQSDTRMPEKAEAEGFITAAPQGIGKSWNAGVCCGKAHNQKVDDVGLTRDLIAALRAEFAIDPSRIYATGFSNGGAMVYRLACELSDVLAAVAPVGGALAVVSCEPSEPIPMLIINNVDDPVVNFDLATFSFDAWRDLNGCGGEPTVTEPAAMTECQSYECVAPTALCAVSGPGHMWPGGLTNPNTPFDATDAVWDFFRAHSRAMNSAP